MSCGLPIGNLTSQWWGNHYLDGLDHFVKRQLKIPHYQRYMDDFTLLAESRELLLEAREAVREWLWNERRLELKAPHAQPRPTEGCFTYLGYRVSRTGVKPSHGMLRRMRQKLGLAVLRGGVDLMRSVDSYRGLLTFALTKPDK